MISIIKRLFEEVFDKNIDLYNEHINMIRSEYNKIMTILSVSDSIFEVRYEVHKLVGLLANLLVSSTNELLYWCKLLLILDKSDLTITMDSYKPYIQEIVDFNKSKFGL